MTIKVINTIVNSMILIFQGVTCAARLGRSVVHIIRLYTGVEFMPQLSSYMQYYSMVRYFTHHSSLKGVKIQSLNLLYGVIYTP